MATTWSCAMLTDGYLGGPRMRPEYAEKKGAQHNTTPGGGANASAGRQARDAVDAGQQGVKALHERQLEPQRAGLVHRVPEGLVDLERPRCLDILECGHAVL